nr:NlpC/P60 family protein [uncultured Cohaesibacter sp.]
MSWSDKFVGIPFKDLGREMAGADCWGLVYLVYQQECAIDLPSYSGDYQTADERAEVARLIGEAEASSVWTKVDDPQVFDVVTFRRGRLTSHVGIILRPGWMLHMSEVGARVENYLLPSWSQRLIGVYRHCERHL